LQAVVQSLPQGTKDKVDCATALSALHVVDIVANVRREA
jgi:hypothetical protein